MARFYIHLVDDLAVRDEDGLELPDTLAAREAALAAIRGLMSDEVRKGRLSFRRRIVVEDEAEETILRIGFRDAIRLEM